MSGQFEEVDLQESRFMERFGQSDVDSCPVAADSDVETDVSTENKEVEKITKLDLDVANDDPQANTVATVAQQHGRRIGKLLGKGRFGEVYEVQEVETGAQEVVKVARKNATSVLEMKVMQKLPKHQFIIEHIFSCESFGNVYIFMQHGGDVHLRQYQELAPCGMANGCLDLRTTLAIFTAVADAVMHIHSHGMCHRDIKGENVIIDEQGRPRLTDFGLVASLRQPLKDMVGSLPFCAPEVLDEDEDGYDGDIADCFSMGVLLCEMFYGADCILRELCWDETAKALENPASLAADLRAFVSHPERGPWCHGSERDYPLRQALFSLLDPDPCTRPYLDVVCELVDPCGRTPCASYQHLPEIRSPGHSMTRLPEIRSPANSDSPYPSRVELPLQLLPEIDEDFP